jgi:hypothetical protein
MIAYEILPIILRFRWETPNPIESEKLVGNPFAEGSCRLSLTRLQTGNAPPLHINSITKYFIF